MKKVFGMILAIIVSITSVMFAFSWLKFDQKTASAASIYDFKESKLQNKVDILGTNYQIEYSSQLKQNQAPFDEENEKMMTGYSFFPTEDSLKQVNASYYLNGFSISKAESIFMWIFIPTEQTNKLTLTFEAGSDYIKWDYETGELLTILKDLSTDMVSGWRLFEFCVNDADMSDGAKNNLSSLSFTKMNLIYANELEVILTETNNKFAFYHVYKATSYLTESGIAKAQEYSVFKAKEEAFSKHYFIDEEIYFVSAEDIFEYLYVGQLNLLEYPSTNYSWEFVMIDSESEENDYTFGEKYVFEKYGIHRLNLTLYEYRKDDTAIVMFTQFSFNVERFMLGSFTNIGYKVNVGETKLIKFKISDYFEIVENTLIVEVSNKNKASVTYYLKDNICYIELTGLKDGDIMITAQAQSKNFDSNEPKTYFCTTEVEVVDDDKMSSEEIFLWVIFGVCGTGFAIFVVISLVKSRYDGVK